MPLAEPQIPQHASRRKRVVAGRGVRWAILAVAMGAVLVASQGFFLPAIVEQRNGLTFAAGDLAHALETQTAAQSAGHPTRVISTFADDRETPCRAFIRSDLSGIACRRAGGWHLAVQRDGADIAANDPRKFAAVERAIADAIRARPAARFLDADEEREMLERGWEAQ
ncbi:hypothetical protein GRI40_02470 [Altererythrobacter aerius]|uniref:Uncharacterized protein n=1 Tax=Tsuneonella aeria TaxID=1837929 RepID=A0A6I4TD02_9SPHN|nr:hypothetical protein [Tsuneonella aeria]MXO74085.1 hypothetical protein [Tsuneonella aeria]